MNGSIEETGIVIYHSKMTHGNNKKKFVVYTAEDFIDAIFPTYSRKMISDGTLYYHYSNKSRGTRRKQGILMPGDETFPNVSSGVDVIPG